MLSGICMVLAAIFSIFGLAYDIMMARSGVFSFYVCSSILISGGIALVVIGWGFSDVPVKRNK